MTPESAHIGRTNLAVVSHDGQVSPSESVVWVSPAVKKRAYPARLFLSEAGFSMMGE